MTKLNNLLKKKTVQLSHDDIEEIISNFPNIGEANYKKLSKAYANGKGCRICLDEDELSGSGFGSMAKKGLKVGAKAITQNKQLSRLKDQAINQGLNYAVNQSGLDEDTGALVKGLARKTINRQIDTMAGSGFGSMTRKGLKVGAKAITQNKQLSRLKDQAINQGLNYVVNQSGLDEDTGALVKGLARKTINKQIDTMAGSGMFNKKLGRKVLKTGAKVLKVGNKISNSMGYDDLDDMAIDFATQQTLGRIDPTLGNLASHQLNRLADKQIDKYSGGNINPYLPKQLSGSGLRGGAMTYDDLSNQVHVGHDAYNPKAFNDPMFDRLKMFQKMNGKGFKVYQ